MNNTTKIAIPAWRDEVAPTFDFAGAIEFFSLCENEIIHHGKVNVQNLPEPAKIALLAENSVQTLLCGAISRSTAMMVTNAGVKLMPYVTGPVADVIEAFKNGTLQSEKFIMPGCWCPRRRRRRGRGPAGGQRIAKSPRPGQGRGKMNF